MLLVFLEKDTMKDPTRINLMNSRGPPDTPTDIETFPQNNHMKIYGANPFTILNISLENNAEVK